MRDNRKAEEVAENRFKIIAPVLLAKETGADMAKIYQIRQEVCAQHGISLRTLKRWVKAHEKAGFKGLCPAPKTYTQAKPLTEELIQAAIMLRREVPRRSVPTIIEILELEGKAPKGAIKESTLQDKLMERGYSMRHMRLYQETGVAARRFQRLERNDLWQADIKFGPKIMVKGENRQIYLAAFIDDATRFIIHAEFYPNMEQAIIEDCLKKAIIKEGIPLRLYFDNGGQFRNKWMERLCAKLGIKLLFTKPYSPEAKGKIERFNRTVDAFFAEASLQNLQTLDAYNHYLKIWISECYHNKVHSALKTTPKNAYQNSMAPLRFPDPNILAEAFLHSDTRQVDKSGCISLDKQLYEVSLTLIGRQVEVIYDPMDKTEITVKHEATGFTKRTKKLAIGTSAAARPKLPNTMLPTTASSSRLLDAKEAVFDTKDQEKRYAIRYSAFEDDDISDLSGLLGSQLLPAAKATQASSDFFPIGGDANV